MENQKEKLKVLVSGCNGAMGKLLIEVINARDDMEVIIGLDQSKNDSSDFTIVNDISNLYELDCLPDVIIDFSAPSCTMKLLNYALDNTIPMVIATTGFSEEDIKLIKNFSQKIPIFMSANMSYVVNIMRKTLYQLAPKLADFDIEISEMHHNRKKDAPSGTAKMLAESIKNALNGKRKIISNRTGKRENDEIGISSIRGGDATGVHTVYFLGDGETLEITHRTSSRKVFAIGAVKAAEFIACQKNPGLYNMNNLE